MPPIVILCLQLIIGTVCDASPYILPAASGHAPLLSSSSSVLASAPSGHRMSSIGTSKRQPTTLIESGDGFAYRQHHQPPGQKQHQPPDEGYGLYGQHHFQQPQPHPPGHRHLQPSFHHALGAEDFMSEMPAESLDYDQQRADQFDLAFPEVPPSSSASAEMENEIDVSPLFAALASAAAESRKPSSSSSASSPSTAGNNNNNHNNGGESFDLIRESLERIKEEEDIDIKSGLLMRLLEQMPEGPLPVVYIEDSAGKGAEEDGTDGGDTGIVVEGEDQSTTGNGNKRSGRYYRRYPWKRQNSRSRTYDADARYLCVPSRDDIFKLLVGLHENRTGNHQRTINFCNRKRPAKAIFTNIRFLG